MSKEKERKSRVDDDIGKGININTKGVIWYDSIQYLLQIVFTVKWHQRFIFFVSIVSFKMLKKAC